MKRSHWFRALVIVSALVLALVYLFPTLRTKQLDNELNQSLMEISEATGMPFEVLREEIFRFSVNLPGQVREIEGLDEETRQQVIDTIDYLRNEFYDSYNAAQDGTIRLGLDLQGGIYLVLEVNVVELMDNIAQNRDERYEEISAEIHRRLRAEPQTDYEGVISNVFQEYDVQMARYLGSPNEPNSVILNRLREDADDAVELTLVKLRNRIDEFGVSEPVITQQGGRRILVELPGVQDPDRARRLIGRTALLEFKFVADPNTIANVLDDIDSYLAEEFRERRARGEDPLSDLMETTAVEESATSVSDDVAAETTEESDEDEVGTGFSEEDFMASANDSLTTEVDENRPFSSMCFLDQTGRLSVEAGNYDLVRRYLERPEILDLVPHGYAFRWSHRAQETGDGNSYWHLYLTEDHAQLTGARLDDAYVNIGSGGNDPTQAGAAIVHLLLDREGARTFARVTDEPNIGRFLAIILDDRVHMAPRIRDRIPNGQAIIEGSESVEEAQDLAIVLRAGALPAPVDIIQERSVGPTLGSDSIRAGTLSAILGLVLVMLFMLFYYRGAGIVADFVLLLNIVFLMAVLAGFGFTLTLPGIAGIILTIGMAVDANVLIYERIREEIRSGKTVWNAIQAGYERAAMTILDANITTLIAGIVLYQFGTGPIRGFALTLMIGIISSIFTALIVSRAIFDWITSRWTLKKLSI